MSLHNIGAVLDINIFPTSGGGSILKSTTSKEKWLGSGIVTYATNSGLAWGGLFGSATNNKEKYDPVHFYDPKVKRYPSTGSMEQEYYKLFSDLTQNQVYNVDLIT